MKSWFAGRNCPAPGATDDELPGWPILAASRACCCPATPTVTVIIPPTAARRHPVDLLLCDHHHRASAASLHAVGATAYDSSGTQIMPAAGAASPREPAPAGTHQVPR